MNTAALGRLLAALRASGYQFTTTTPATHARVNARPSNAWARDTRDVLGWSRPFRNGAVPPALAAIMAEAGMLVAHGPGQASALRVSSLDEMLFLHSAFPTEAADAVFFGPDTYRFAAAIQDWLDRPHGPVRRAVDIGCGAGPGACVVARSVADAEVIGVDINQHALALARVNAAAAGLGQVTFQPSDLLSAVTGDFDLIVSNPPYLADAAERAYRHGGGPLGAGLSLAILDAALARLAPRGTLLLYTGAAIVSGGDPFKSAAAERLAATKVAWTYREVDPDVFGEELASGPYLEADRIAAVVLTATRKE